MSFFRVALVPNPQSKVLVSGEWVTHPLPFEMYLADFDLCILRRLKQPWQDSRGSRRWYAGECRRGDKRGRVRRCRCC